MEEEESERHVCGVDGERRGSQTCTGTCVLVEGECSVGGENALVYVSKCVRVLARVALVRERERERM